ncbi:MAG: zf-TFIIB domain-containing protein [Planctomycetaceae bacterium]|nr:zf-TFIIB domain-containing protein [Planctomycetaceae bacterium]
MATRLCPTCINIALKEKTLSDRQTKIDICPKCRGGWFDATELSRVLSVAINDLDPPADAEASDRKCPKCEMMLTRFDYPDTSIEVDMCRGCSGIWLDRGEFSMLNRDRAKHQDRAKLQEKEIAALPKPKTFKEAVVSFVDRMMVKFDV